PTDADNVPISPTVQFRKMLAISSWLNGRPQTDSSLNDVVTFDSPPAADSAGPSSRSSIKASNSNAISDIAFRSWAKVAAWFFCVQRTSRCSYLEGQPQNAHCTRAANGSEKSAIKSV